MEVLTEMFEGGNCLRDYELTLFEHIVLLHWKAFLENRGNIWR